MRSVHFARALLATITIVGLPISEVHAQDFLRNFADNARFYPGDFLQTSYKLLDFTPQTPGCAPYRSYPDGTYPPPSSSQPEGLYQNRPYGGAFSPDGTPSPNNLSPNGLSDSQFGQSGRGSLSASDTFAASASAVPGAYIDLAAPVNQFRQRFDDAFNNNFPDRGEYFYAKCGCYGPPAKGPGNPGVPEKSVSYQNYSTYIELAPTTRVSAFAEVQVRAENPVVNSNTSGLADMNAGFKYAIVGCPTGYLTFQFRTYIPTGDPRAGLGTGHVSVEPGLLAYRVFRERWIFLGEIKDWIPLAATDPPPGMPGSYDSNVIEFGAGLGYILVDTGCYVVTPVFETVGWTFINGYKINDATGPVSANGDTIVNAKPGVRFGCKKLNDPIGTQRHSFYIGWATAVTKQHLYQDMLRLEYRLIF